MADRPRVVIVGGGFGGLTAARALKRADVDVTLLDRRNHHLFQPLLYQVAMAGLAPTEIATPIRTILSRQKNATVLLADVVGVDFAQRALQLASGERVGYDFLILAPGARTHYFGHDEWALYAPGLKDIDDAIEIRKRVLLAFEAAERATSSEQRRKLLTFVVIGAGPTGVELAGAVAELARYVLARDFRRIHPSETQVLLVEGGARVLSTFDQELSVKAVAQLAELGVQVRTDTLVERITDQGVVLRSGEELNAATIVWAAGVASSPLIAAAGIATDRVGRALVEPDCSIVGHPEVFVIGDAAALDGPDGKPLPGVSPVAMQMGRHVAKLISNGAVDGQRKPFEYVDKGSMATIGRSRAIAQTGALKLSGLLAWLAWLLVHIWYLIGFRNRLLVLFDWAWAYFFYRRGARLITGGRMEPGAPGALKSAATPTHAAATPTPKP